MNEQEWEIRHDESDEPTEKIVDAGDSPTIGLTKEEERHLIESWDRALENAKRKKKEQDGLE